MRYAEILKTHVSLDIKRQAQVVADRELLSEAAWLRRLVLREIHAAEIGTGNSHEFGSARADSGSAGRVRGQFGGKPILVRLRAEDRLLLDARADARGMRAATYVSVLVRSHLRILTPLPKDEFLALRRSIAELASIGRNINQIAKVLNESGTAPGSVREEFRHMLKACEALRDNTKALLKANLESWEAGYDQTNR